MYCVCGYKADRMATKRRKKVRKEFSIQIRVTAEQKKILANAAAKAGLGLSSWLLTTGLKVATVPEKT
jgi:uncharacterized protein (DUF1778 family)